MRFGGTLLATAKTRLIHIKKADHAALKGM